MIFSIVSLLVVNAISNSHSFSTNFGSNTRRSCDPLVRSSLEGPRLHTMFIPQRHWCRHENYRSKIYMVLKTGKKDTDKKAESTFRKDQEDSLSSRLTGINDMLPWEKLKSNGRDRDMGDLTSMLSEPDTNESSTDTLSLGQIVGIGASLALISIPFVLDSLGVSVTPSDISNTVQDFFADPTTVLQSVADSVESMGPLGALYFGAVYTVAEVLAIPAIPLTASAGYLFGVQEGTAIVLLSGTISAAIGFLLGRTFLRSYVEQLLEEKPEFKRIDKAIGKEGFKVILLLRLSPLFPFSLSNYLYGVTSVKFWPYFFGTMLGFAPGTIAYVYSGEVGKALTIESGTAEPWYVYAIGFALFSGILKVVADVATSLIESLEEDADQG